MKSWAWPYHFQSYPPIRALSSSYALLASSTKVSKWSRKFPSLNLKSKVKTGRVIWRKPASCSMGSIRLMCIKVVNALNEIHVLTYSHNIHNIVKELATASGPRNLLCTAKSRKTSYRFTWSNQEVYQIQTIRLYRLFHLQRLGLLSSFLLANILLSASSIRLPADLETSISTDGQNVAQQAPVKMIGYQCSPISLTFWQYYIFHSHCRSPLIRCDLSRKLYKNSLLTVVCTTSSPIKTLVSLLCHLPPSSY